jgi:hypothetical protein
MYSIKSTLDALLPDGITNIEILGDEDGRFDRRRERRPWSADWMPLWPPDLFAVCGVLIERVGAYASPDFFGSARKLNGAMFRFSFNDSKQASRVGKIARQLDRLLAQVVEHPGRWPGKPDQEPMTTLLMLWRGLVAKPDTPFQEQSPEELLSWQSCAMMLAVICDECCASVGFPVTSQPRSNGNTVRRPQFVREFVSFQQKLAALLNRFSGSNHAEVHVEEKNHERERSQNKLLAQSASFLPKPYQSLCRDVPGEVAVVLPKTSTPTLGCTLRSLTHHVALLPGQGLVKTYWVPAVDRQPAPQDGDALNLLLVPYPYHVSARNFETFEIGGPQDRNIGRFFHVTQEWVRHRPGTSGDQWVRSLFRFIDSLIAEAQKEVDQVHGVVLPELALTSSAAELLAAKLADIRGVEFLFCGASQPPSAAMDSAGGLGRHGVYAAFFQPNRVEFEYFQGKHHRWKVDRFQISRYHLGDKLNPQWNWWEALDVSGRTCHFYPFRPHMSLTALVCEDLARVEPVQPVIRAVGPNLMIVLLMDGPQLGNRWPSRYATILADDPGSSVLTLTCRGMLRRSARNGQTVPNQIALWRDCTNPEATELHLAPDAHGLLLTLSATTMTQTSLDGRTLEDLPKRLSLTGTVELKSTVPVP